MNAPARTDLLEAALRHAENGRHVFPCTPLDKTPACTNGFKDATRDPEIIRAWWTAMPDANIGWSPDHDGCFVLDQDGPKGAETLAELELEHGFLPLTRTIQTPRGEGHLHRVFKGKCASSVGRVNEKTGKIIGLGPKLDVRGFGGYVLLEPSRVRYEDGSEGSYTVVDDRAKADGPAWIAAMLNSRYAEQAASANVELDLPASVARADTLLNGYKASGDVAVSGAGGNNRTYQLGCEVIALGLRPATAFDRIKKIWNPACEPPWEDDDLAVIVSHAGDYMQNQAGAWAVKSGAETFADFAASLPDTQVETDEDASAQFRFVLRDPVADAKRPPITFRDDARLWPNSPEGTVSQIISGPKQHKTGLNLSEKYRMARAGTARVLNIPLEGEYGVATQRLPALAEFYGDPLERLLGRFQIASAPGFALDNPESVAALIKFANETGKQFGLGGWTDIDLDTQHRSAGALEENSATDSRILWNAVDRIRRGVRQDDGRFCNVTLLHHTGKDVTKGGRGSSADEAAVDQLLELKTDKASGTAVVTVKARKDGPDGITARFKIEPAGALKVPVLVPVSDSDYRALTGADDPYGNSKIGAALRSLKAFGKAKAVKTPILATSLIRLWGELEADYAVQDANERTVANRLNERVKKGHYGGYLVHLVGEPVKPHLWCLPEELAAEGPQDEGDEL